VSPHNEASLRMVRRLGFHQTDEQWEEEDGLELVFERHTETPTPYTPHDTT
jgi:hypothetical protein